MSRHDVPVDLPQPLADPRRDRKAVLGEIFSAARSNNKRQDITGALLLSGDYFVQALEGDEEAVQRLYEHIAKDDRHADVTVVDERQLDERTFGEVVDGPGRRRRLRGHPAADEPGQGRDHPQGRRADDRGPGRRPRLHARSRAAVAVLPDRSAAARHLLQPGRSGPPSAGAWRTSAPSAPRAGTGWRSSGATGTVRLGSGGSGAAAVPYCSLCRADASASGSPVSSAPDASAWYSRDRLTAICTTPAAIGPSSATRIIAIGFGRSSSPPPNMPNRTSRTGQER